MPITGSGLTKTVVVSELTQPAAEVPDTEYTVVTAGVAVGLLQPVHDNPVPGYQL
jgi:hypothetical protein